MKIIRNICFISFLVIILSFMSVFLLAMGPWAKFGRITLFGAVPAAAHGSNAKIVFQSSFMLMTVQPLFLASAISASLNVPIFDSAP